MASGFSVIIPTRDRRDSLRLVLDGLAAQREAPSFEVVVVSDGSADGTADDLRARRDPYPLEIIERPPAGPAAARNAGIEAAQGERLCFLGDDTIPEPGWLAAHARAHRRRGNPGDLAAVGRTTRHSDVADTPFLRFLDERGLQFGYRLIADPEAVPPRFFYTSNLSLTRGALSDERFDEGFPHAAWEDIELGYRLERRGLHLVYEKSAVVRHRHETNLDSFARRQVEAGAAAVHFLRRHPEAAPLVGVRPGGEPYLPPVIVRRIIHWCARLSTALPVAFPSLWAAALAIPYREGVIRELDRTAAETPEGTTDL